MEKTRYDKFVECVDWAPGSVAANGPAEVEYQTCWRYYRTVGCYGNINKCHRGIEVYHLDRLGGK